MKKRLENVCYILASAVSWKVLAWAVSFLILEFFATNLDFVNPALVQGCSYAISFIQIMLIIGFMGFLFLSSVGAKENKENPLSAVLSREVFVQGINVIFAFFVVAIPFFIVWMIAEWIQVKESYLNLGTLILVYISFGLFPTYMQMVQEYPNNSIKNSLWQFFKKNASSVFACVFWYGVLFVALIYSVDYILFVAKIHSESWVVLLGCVFLPYFLLCYVLVVGALLIGVSLRKTAVLEIDGNMQKPEMKKGHRLKPRK